jgi:hypothetical protein
MKNKELEDISFDQGTHIVQFLKSHPFISVKQLEKTAEMPKSSLAGAMAGKRKIPKTYWYTLNNILANYGYSIDTAVNVDPMPDLILPFKYLDICCLESGIAISKNFEEVELVKDFLNNILIAIERIQPSEVTKYGNEFILKSRLIEYGFATDENPDGRRGGI